MALYHGRAHRSCAQEPIIRTLNSIARTLNSIAGHSAEAKKTVVPRSNPFVLHAL